jgi:protein TonB
VIRLVLAALLAIGVHATLFRLEVPRSQPRLMLRQSRAVSIDLVTFQKPVEKPVPPPPKVVESRPKPKPKPKPKPVIKPLIQPPPAAPRPIVSKPVHEPPPFDADIGVQEAALEPDAVTTNQNSAAKAENRPAVQASVPRYDLNPPPHYPRVARRRNYAGTVMLDVLVTVEGRVEQVRIVESSGHDVLDQSALKSVKGWQFTPARQGDRPVEMWVQVPVRYELR